MLKVTTVVTNLLEMSKEINAKEAHQLIKGIDGENNATAVISVYRDMEPSHIVLNNLFDSWTEEVGYNKAVLLSLNYPIKKVMEYSEEDAEAELDALKN